MSLNSEIKRVRVRENVCAPKSNQPSFPSCFRLSQVKRDMSGTGHIVLTTPPLLGDFGARLTPPNTRIVVN